MEIKELEIPGVFEISLKPIEDNRGFFLRTYDDSFFKRNFLSTNWVQENHSFSKKKGTVRGLHFQLPPYSETKVVRCLNGEIMDVFLDLRKGSPTFGKWGYIILNSSKFNMVYIPRGMAHGFITLEDNCQVFYKVDNYYSKGHELGILWNDPHLNIIWPSLEITISEKDSKNLTFNEFIKSYKYIEI